jgi:hypothetical protein
MRDRASWEVHIVKTAQYPDSIFVADGTGHTELR